MKKKKVWKFIYKIVDYCFLFATIMVRMLFVTAAIVIFAIYNPVNDLISIAGALWILQPIWNRVKHKVKQSIGWYSNE